MFRKNRAPAVPARQPHPDPRTETRLQRIISLRETVARKRSLIDQYADEIDVLSAVYHNAAGFNPGRAQAAEKRLKDLQGEIRQLEGEIEATHDEIAKRTEELDDTDLSYL